jgi:hypothetical protein
MVHVFFRHGFYRFAEISMLYFSALPALKYVLRAQKNARTMPVMDLVPCKEIR